VKLLTFNRDGAEQRDLNRLPEASA